MLQVEKFDNSLIDELVAGKSKFNVLLYLALWNAGKQLFLAIYFSAAASATNSAWLVFADKRRAHLSKYNHLAGGKVCE